MRNWIRKIYFYSPAKRIQRQIEQVIAERSYSLLAENRQAITKLESLIGDLEVSVRGVHAEVRSVVETNDINLNVLQQTVNKISVDTSNLTVLGAKRPIVVFFLIHNIEVWSSLHGVYDAMSGDSNFDVIVASCNRRYPSGDNYGEEGIVHSGLEGMKIHHIRLTSQDSYQDLDIVKRLRPDIIFRQSQWDLDIPEAFSVKNLRFARLYSVSYAVMPLTDHSFGSADDNYYRRSVEHVFVLNDEVKQLYNMADENRLSVVATGHPRVDEIIRTMPSWPMVTKNKFRVIWSAHHSIFEGWNDFGTFLSTYKIMLKLAKEYEDIDFLFSLHPGLIGSFERLAREDAKEKEKVDRFLADWNDLSNTHTLQHGGYVGPMKASDLLITDGISLLLEYQLVEKPIIFIERDGHSEFNRFGERIKEGTNILNSKNIDKLQDMVLYYKNGGVDKRKSYQKRNVSFLTEKTNASQNIVESIKKDFYKAGVK